MCATACADLSFNRWVVEAITSWEFAAWPEAFHHLALTRMLGIGFCGNEDYGMPAMSDLLDQLSNATSVTSYDQALDAARVKFGNPVRSHTLPQLFLPSHVHQLLTRRVFSPLF